MLLCVLMHPNKVYKYTDAPIRTSRNNEIENKIDELKNTVDNRI